ncbi:UPF0182 family protein [Salinispira pacifica]|uniref:UPF0182 protein L21SP2_1487 n=1 Tax=Salinispira pacifica TaxID=1307761 RepID=V5WH51_9SPIO|nr:UPF0182 family protein [Salinispira pacifica]AHC14884.1 INTEGRAL MEMBRANE PROTEIN (Rhomboid family) [Salinispira pacifica]
MYVLLFALTAAAGGFFILQAVRKKKAGPAVIGVGILLALLVFTWFMDFWGEKLWFDSLGYTDRFWTEFAARVVTGAAFFLMGGLASLLFAHSVNGMRKSYRLLFAGSAALISGFIGAGQWENALRFLRGGSGGISDPILGIDAGFYLFTLPFLRGVYALLITLAVFFVLLGSMSANPRGLSLLRNSLFASNTPNRDRTESPDKENDPDKIESRDGSYTAIIAASVFLLLVLSYNLILTRFELLFDTQGVVSGPGWTSVNIRMPMLLAAAGLGVVAAGLLSIPGLRRQLSRKGAAILSRFSSRKLPGAFWAPASVFTALFALWGIILGLIPWLVQSLLVAPNEITYEQPYIEHNIAFTRKAFSLDTVQEREFSVDGDFTPQAVETNRGIIDNTRLWDWRALSSVYEQFQEIRLYYEFGDIDVDRYTIDGENRTVMVAAREMVTENLPEQSRNFVNRRFKYTHGYGIAMNTVNEFTSSGLPHLLIRDIPPVSESEELRVDRPEIYYGEKSDSYVIVNSSEEEFDYPEGDSNRYVSYEGQGGVEISGLFRKFMYGYKFGGTKLLFSSYPDAESRIMFHRNIRNRVQEVAPFLEFDRDPYIVLADGKLKWMLDAYTTSASYPYSEHFNSRVFESSFAESGADTLAGRGSRGVNYVRNSVKAVIDPYSGEVNMYIFDESDPVVKVWQRIYPELFQSRDEMPETLEKHIRYPSDFLLMQGEVYAKYHMTDPEVFYNQEDLWVRATEKYYSDVMPVEPYYFMWERPGSDRPEFINMLPYTPKNKQVLIGWIAGVSDPENYGDFIAYKFPKEQRVLGPQQVETKIDQDSFLSGQLSLWDQRGSNVIRGNVLVLPLDGTLLYVEPIYLQSETAAYPELRMVVLMHKDTLSYAETLEEALQGLFDNGQPAAAEASQSSSQDASQTGAQTAEDASGRPSSELIREAQQAFDSYTTATGEGRYEDAARALQQLQNLLQQLGSRE